MFRHPYPVGKQPSEKRRDGRAVRREPCGAANTFLRIGGKYGKYSPILDKIEIEDARYGYINNLGIERIPILYSHANDFSEGLAAVCMHNKWGFINRTGNVVVPLKYDCVHDFKSGFAQVFYNGKKLGINMRGEEFDIKFIELVRRLNLKGTPDDVD